MHMVLHGQFEPWTS